MTEQSVQTQSESPRIIRETQLPKEVGQPVVLPDGTQYSISGVYGKAKLIHTIEGSGRWFVYWHDSIDPSYVVANGSREGFPDIFVVKRQLVHVIDRYLGYKVEIPSELDNDSIESPQTYSGMATQLRLKLFSSQHEEAVIPGEQQVIGQWISALQSLDQDIRNTRNVSELTGVRAKVGEIVRGPISRATNHYKRDARQVLERGLVGSRAELLSGILKSQVSLLVRAQDIVGKTSGSMERINDLEAVLLDWNNVVRNLYDRLGHIVTRALQPTYPADRRENTLKAAFSNPDAGLAGGLRRMSGEPYFNRAQSFIKALSPAYRHWERGNLSGIKNITLQQMDRAKTWKEDIEDFERGFDFGHYQLAS